MVEFRGIPVLLMLRVAWLLEDIVDKLLGVERGAKFYPSAIFEDIFMGFHREGGKCEFEEECRIELNFKESCPFYENSFCTYIILLEKPLN